MVIFTGLTLQAFSSFAAALSPNADSTIKVFVSIVNQRGIIRVLEFPLRVFRLPFSALAPLRNPCNELFLRIPEEGPPSHRIFFVQ